MEPDGVSSFQDIQFNMPGIPTALRGDHSAGLTGWRNDFIRIFHFPPPVFGLRAVERALIYSPL